MILPPLQAAIDDAGVVDGDVISIVADTYTITSTITVSKALTLQGADEATTIIQAGGALTNMINIPRYGDRP